jgi:hypothetical protein
MVKVNSGSYSGMHAIALNMISDRGEFFYAENIG